METEEKWVDGEIVDGSRGREPVDRREWKLWSVWKIKEKCELKKKVKKKDF